MILTEHACPGGGCPCRAPVGDPVTDRTAAQLRVWRELAYVALRQAGRPVRAEELHTLRYLGSDLLVTALYDLVSDGRAKLSGGRFRAVRA